MMPLVHCTIETKDCTKEDKKEAQIGMQLQAELSTTVLLDLATGNPALEGRLSLTSTRSY